MHQPTLLLVDVPLMLLSENSEVWKMAAAVIAVITAVFMGVRRLLRPWLSKTVIWLLEQEDNHFVVSLTRMILSRENSPGVKSMLDKLNRDRIQTSDTRLEGLELGQDRLERSIGLAHQSLGTLSIAVDGHDELMQTIAKAVSENNALSRSQIEMMTRLNTTLDTLSSDIKAHTSEIGEIRGFIKSLRDN